MYGAIGDGITDDTNAIQNALTYLKSCGGGTLFFPVGTYYITDHIVINFNNCTIKGAASGGSIIKVGAWVDGIRVSDDAYPSTKVIIKNVVIENLTINGNRDGYTNGSSDTYGNGINLNSVSNAIVRNCLVYDVAEQGIVITDWNAGVDNQSAAYTNIIKNCTVLNTRAGRIAIGGEGYFQNASIINNTIIRSTSGDSITISNNGGSLGNSNDLIAHNHIISQSTSGNGIHIGQGVDGVIISDNLIEGCEVSCRISVDAGWVNNISILNNRFKNFSGYGIMTFPLGETTDFNAIISNNSIITDCSIDTGWGILACGGIINNNNINITNITNAGGIALEGNKIKCFGNIIKLAGSGYSISSSATNSSITDNTISTSLNITGSGLNENNRNFTATASKLKKTLTGTLGNYGEIGLNITTDYTILSIYSNTTNQLITPYVNENGWYCQVKDITGSYATGTITITYFIESNIDFI